MSFQRAASLDDLWIGEMIGVVVGGTRVLLVNVEGEVSAFEDRCAHLAVPLSEGRLEGALLTCSAHAWQYDARTGESQNPRGARLRALPVRIEGEELFVDVSPAEGA